MRWKWKAHYLVVIIQAMGGVPGVPCWPQLTSPGLLDHTRRTQSPSVRQPATSRHHLDTPVPVSSTFWPKYFFHFCTAIGWVPTYPIQCIAMLKIKGSTYTRFKKLHMSEVPNAIRFRETFKVHWWIKDETALSFFHFLQALLWNVLLMMRNDWHRMFRIRN